MVVYVVKITRYGYGTDSDTVDIYGVYSNLALAGRAVTIIVDDAKANGDALTYVRFEKPWVISSNSMFWKVVNGIMVKLKSAA